MAITWRNVDAPDARSALLGLTTANQSFNAGFDKIGEVLKQREQLATDNWNQQKVNNTNTVMDSMMEAKTPEELQAKEAFLAQMRQGMGAQVDAQAIRAAQDARLPMLQQRAKTGIEYKNFMTDEDQAKVRDQVGVLIASGKTEEAMALAQSAGLRQMAPVMAAGNAEQRLRTELGYKEAAEKRAVEDQAMQAALHPLQLEAQRQTIANSKTSNEHTQVQIEAARRELGSTGGTKKIDAALETLIPKTAYSAGMVGTKDGDANLLKGLNEVVNNDDHKEDIIYNVNKFINSDGYKKKFGNTPIPVTAALQAIGQSTENVAAGLVPGWSRRGDNAVNILEGLLDKNGAQYQEDYAQINNLQKSKILKSLGMEAAPEQGSSLVPPAKETPTDAPTKSLDAAAKKTAPAAKEVDPQVQALADARKTLKDAFTATQADIRKVGGVDNITDAQRAELKRIQVASNLLDEQEAKLLPTLDSTLSERRRKADQEEARKNSLGR